VLEIGIGGRYDAVNAVANMLAVFTPIEAEHVAMLGGSLESVAWHKAGIIQPGGRAVSVPQLPSVMAVLEREASEKGAKLSVAEDLAKDFPIGSRPPLRVPGRLEPVIIGDHNVIIDGGHTANAANYLRQFMGKTASIRLIVGMLRDKNVPAYLKVFDAPNVHFVYTRAPGDRALTPDELLERYTPTQASVTLTPSLDAALRDVGGAPEPLIVVCGSLRMAAAAREAFGLLTPDALDEARRTRAIFEGEGYLGKLRDR
jgi:folylpolyglutamate synthase/dihydropteroate synthase